MACKIIINHIGFLCSAIKKVIIECSDPVYEFEIQDMGRVDSESFDADENWITVYKGRLQKKQGPDGELYEGDFSSITRPGIYSVVLPEQKSRSYHFIISDGVFRDLPWLFVDFLHRWKGNVETPLKGKSTSDDGIRSDNGTYHPVRSGWYDAGDLRKWMTHTNLPALGFYQLAENLNLSRNFFHEEKLFDNDLLTVSDEAINLILEMQDPESGKIFECIGAGGFGRADENMSWWYENHSGCLADNSDNRFTDNVPSSGDERTIRTDYNGLIQYISIFILLKSYKFYKDRFPEKAAQIYIAAQRIWKNASQESYRDPSETKTAFKSWKLLAGIELFRSGWVGPDAVTNLATELLKNFHHRISFWCQDEKHDDPYRGILHSAQPLIALMNLLGLEIAAELRSRIEKNLVASWENYVLPLCEYTVFGYMPYGTYFQPASKEDRYTPWKNGLLLRRFMPNHSPQKINHGLNGHYTSWANALALMGNHFNDPLMKQMAWNQIYWTLGYNPFNVSFISGVGYNNPMPHSRFLGTSIGGYMSGFIGNTDDTPHVDLQAKAQWNTTEYWVTPKANLCLALAELLPAEVDPREKLGSSQAG
jgi:hypothetical protein